MSARTHVVITGTGRAGTTFLVELMTHLGFDTGFGLDDLMSMKEVEARAGLEYDLRRDDCPFVVKSPWFCDYADEVIYRDDIVIEHILIPIRDLSAAAESRRYVSESSVSKLPITERLKQMIRPIGFDGGLWHTQSRRPGRQEQVLLGQIYKLMLAIADTTIPVTFIRYPRMVKDRSYLFDKLKPVFPGITLESFCTTFDKTVRPELVHSFNENDC